MAAQSSGWAFIDLKSAGAERHVIVPRAAAGLPLLVIGLAHVFDDTAPMRPLVEAANLPAAALLSPVAVAAEILAGALLLAGLYARLGSLIAIPTMVVAVYAHFAIDVWPNPGGEPPIALPIIVMACAVYVFLRGAGAWSVDSRLSGPNGRPVSNS